MTNDKVVIGLAGGIGSGKSEVARLLADQGAAVISSDEIAQRALDSQDVLDTIRQWWGPQVIDPNGRADRRRIARLVFEDSFQRKRLESILHPRVAQERERRMQEARKRADVRAIVLDSPLLFESGIEKECDYVVFVEAPDEVRRARVAQGRGWSADELSRREQTQESPDSKRERSDYICVNDSDLNTLRLRVQDIFDQIVSRGTDQPLPSASL